MIQEHHINPRNFTRHMQDPNPLITRSHHHLDDIRQSRDLNQRLDHLCELGAALERILLLPARRAQRVGEQDRRVAAVAAQLEHGRGLDFTDQLRHDAAFVFADVHEVLFRAPELIDGVEDGRGRAPNIGLLGFHELDEFFFSAVVELCLVSGG